MAGVFVSYRREDSSGWAGRLSRALRDRFGEDQVFMDIDTLEPGIDSTEAIERYLSLSNVLLAVIGPRWLEVRDRSNRRRLDDPDDLVRREVATALTRNIPVIPVLVGGASMPSVEDLPENLRDVARRNAYECSDRRWDYDQRWKAEGAL